MTEFRRNYILHSKLDVVEYLPLPETLLTYKNKTFSSISLVLNNIKNIQSHFTNIILAGLSESSLWTPICRTNNKVCGI